MNQCPSCGSILEQDLMTETRADDPTGITISAQDFELLFTSFRQLTSPYSSDDELAEIIRFENDIWRWLQRIKNGEPRASLVRPSTQ